LSGVIFLLLRDKRLVPSAKRNQPRLGECVNGVFWKSSMVGGQAVFSVLGVLKCLTRDRVPWQRVIKRLVDGLFMLSRPSCR
jgi:hypothetical protein